jgi:hypothetical protein
MAHMEPAQLVAAPSIDESAARRAEGGNVSRANVGDKRGSFGVFGVASACPAT